MFGCDDYLRFNASAISGLYKIRLGKEGGTKTVHCHFDRVNSEVWTLVMSYSFSNNAVFKVLPFQEDRPINEDNPVFNDKYRASLGLMTYLRKKTSFWRATCNHNTKIGDDDFVWSNFSTIDVMTYNGEYVIKNL